MKNLAQFFLNMLFGNKSEFSFKQRISLAIQSANTACALGTINDRTTFEELLITCTEEPGEFSFKQRISLAIQSANTACALGTINDRTTFEELFFLLGVKETKVQLYLSIRKTSGLLLGQFF